MRVRPEADPDVADEAPTVMAITPYDEAHFVTYLRLLDANAERADWKDVSRIVLHRDPQSDPFRTRRCWQSHLDRAIWMTEHGFRELFEIASANDNSGWNRP
jgi:hypothetical protein